MFFFSYISKGMFVAAAIKELRHSVLNTMICLVRHYTMIAVVQQAGPLPCNKLHLPIHSLDAFVLIDALAVIMGHEEKELCKPGHVALVLIEQTATTILGNYKLSKDIFNHYYCEIKFLYVHVYIYA